MRHTVQTRSAAVSVTLNGLFPVPPESDKRRGDKHDHEDVLPRRTLRRREVARILGQLLPLGVQLGGHQ